MKTLELVLFGLGGLFLVYIVIFKLLGLRIIQSNEVGVVEKWWSRKGDLSSGKFIALNGEAGYQPEVLRAGIHFRSVLLYKIHKVQLITIPQGQIGYVFARDGQPLPETQTLAKSVECNKFQDVREFLENGGQKGPQRQILREGTYAFNLAQFIILTENNTYYLSLGNTIEERELEKMSELLKSIDGFKPICIEGSNDSIGIVTVKDGLALPDGEIIAPVVGQDVSDLETYHNNFQNVEAFLKAGGRRGRQLQVITEGVYFINRLFATIDYAPKTIVPVGYAGVVNSYTGAKGTDLSGEGYGHGELVKEGCRGIWENSLIPGKYAFNIFAGTIMNVPITNFILKWIDNQVGGHKYDENLKEVTLITKDAFEPTLPLSIVIHIDYREASKVIQRFGDIKKLVEQTLDPMVSSYFKNIAQRMTLIELIQNRSVIQEEATKEMKEKFSKYNLDLLEVLIGTPSPNGNTKINDMLLQISDRQLAKEKTETYKAKMLSAEQEKLLKEVEAKAEQQTSLTNSHINIEIQDNEGKARYQKSLRDAETMKVLADAEAIKTKTLADAEAEKIAKIGIAEGIAINEKVMAYGGPQYQVTQEVLNNFTNAIKEGGIDIVPKNLINMGNSEESSNANAFNGLMTLMMSEKIGVNLTNSSIKKEENELSKNMKENILQNINKFPNSSDLKTETKIDTETTKNKTKK